MTETTWTLAADALEHALDTLAAETTPAMTPDGPDATAEVAELYLRLQLAGYRLNDLRARLCETYRTLAVDVEVNPSDGPMPPGVTEVEPW